MRLIFPCLYGESVFNTASFSVLACTEITVFLVSVISDLHLSSRRVSIGLPVYSIPTTNMPLPLYPDTYLIRMVKVGSLENCRFLDRSDIFATVHHFHERNLSVGPLSDSVPPSAYPETTHAAQNIYSYVP